VPYIVYRIPKLITGMRFFLVCPTRADFSHKFYLSKPFRIEIVHEL